MHVRPFEVSSSSPKPVDANAASARQAAPKMACLVLVWLLASILCPNSLAHAATIHVPADRPTIAAGIEAATDGDTVEVAPGEYAGSGILELDFDGKDIVLRSAEGASETVLDCQTLGRAFHFESSVPRTAVVSGFTIRNGRDVLNGFDAARGGAVLIGNGAGPTFDGCRFEDCDAGDYSDLEGRGGGIYIASGASARFVDCVIERCDSRARNSLGGGVYVGTNAGAQFEGCTISECFAGSNNSNDRGYGGAVYVDVGGDVRFLTCTLIRNWTRQESKHCYLTEQGTIGGAAGSTLLIDGCHISDGGGIGMKAGSTAVIVRSTIERERDAILVREGELHLIDTEIRQCYGVGAQVAIREGEAWISSCRLVANRGHDDTICFQEGYSAAIKAEDTQLRLTSTVISGNQSDLSGAALWIKGSNVEIEQCTISNNQATYSQGPAIDCESSTVSIAHSIVWDNCPASIRTTDGSIVSLFCCDVDPALLVPSVGIEVDAECFSIDPEFCRGLSCASVPLVEGEYSLSLGSPCRPLETPCGVLVGALDYGCVAPDAGGACCRTDGTCTVVYAEECFAAGTTFGGAGSDCDPNPCVGACCMDDGTCVVVSPTQCASASGVFTAAAFACEAIVCVPPGACCLPDGACRLLPETDCGEGVGAYLGDGTLCEPIPCDANGACCRALQDCVRLTRSVCQADGGTYLGDGVPCPSIACSSNYNPGGVLLLQANPALVYTQGGDYCGDAGVGALEDITATAPIGQTALLHVLAAFPEGMNPNVSGVVFGIDYEASKIQISHWGSCGDWGYELGNWPAPQSGAYVRWDTSHTEHLFEVYWLAAYASEPTALRLIRHGSEGGDFLGPPEEPTPDPIACFGTMGFGEPGVVCVPQLAAGACCISGDQCVFVSAAACADAGGQFLGYDQPCVPLPCAASTAPEFDTSKGASIALIGSNPVRRELRFQMNANRSGPAIVRLLSVGGTVVATLFDGWLEAGTQERTWTPTTGAMRGVYWLDARISGEQVTRKLIFVP